MRKISKNAYNAFSNNRNFKKANTQVLVENGRTIMYLFGNTIAKKENGEIFISDGGYGPSVTTRDRLNVFPGVHLRINQGSFILNEKMEWDGKWTNINQI
jgi:hypothetical protein